MSKTRQMKKLTFFKGSARVVDGRAIACHGLGHGCVDQGQGGKGTEGESGGNGGFGVGE